MSEAEFIDYVGNLIEIIYKMGLTNAEVTAALVNERREALAAAKRERDEARIALSAAFQRIATIITERDDALLAASECAPSGEPSEEAINKSFEFLNMRLCEFGDKAEMRNLLRAAYAIDAMRPAAITAAVEAEREAIAATHDAEIARLQKQIEENNAYMARVLNMPPENTLAGESRANKFCRDQLRWHERFAASIRARKGEASNGNVG